MYIKVKNISLIALGFFAVSSVLFTSSSYAADGLFSNLMTQGGVIFSGMREIIYAVSGFGLVAIAIGGLFGNLNWKWLVAIIIGLVLIATTASLISYIVGSTAVTSGVITDTLKTGKDS